MFNRWNWEVGEFRKDRKELKDKIAEKELKEQLKIDQYNFDKEGKYIDDENI